MEKEWLIGKVKPPWSHFYLSTKEHSYSFSVAFPSCVPVSTLLWHLTKKWGVTCTDINLLDLTHRAEQTGLELVKSIIGKSLIKQGMWQNELRSSVLAAISQADKGIKDKSRGAETWKELVSFKVSLTFTIVTAKKRDGLVILLRSNIFWTSLKLRWNRVFAPVNTVGLTKWCEADYHTYCELNHLNGLHSLTETNLCG